MRQLLSITLRLPILFTLLIVLMFWIGRQQPGAGMVIFHSDRAGDGGYGLYATNIETGPFHPRILFPVFVSSTPGSMAYSPACSPDGDTIAFIGDFEYNETLYITNSRGTTLRRLSPPDSFANRMPTWSPDGRRLLYFSRRTTGSDYYMVDVETGVETILPGLADAYFPAWSPDGKSIAFTRYGEETGVYRLDSGIEVTVTDTFHSMSRVTWSPDGSRLIFEARTSGSAPFQLYTVNLDGTGLRRLSPLWLQAALMSDWSPDGALIAFTGMDSSNIRDIYLTAPDGEAYALTHDDYDDGNPCWLR